MEVSATAKYIHISPRKVRRVVDMVRGRQVDEALAMLRLLPGRATALAVAKVVKSAAANAENNFDMPPAALHIVRAVADDGPTVRRYRPRARGRVGAILKRSSHITVAVDER